MWEAGAGCSRTGESETASLSHRACLGQLELLLCISGLSHFSSPSKRAAPPGDLSALTATSPGGCVTSTCWPSEFHSLPASTWSPGPVGYTQQPLGSSMASFILEEPLVTCHTPAHSCTSLSTLSLPQAHGMSTSGTQTAPLRR